MKIANKNKFILYLFIYIFGFFVIYYVVINTYYKKSIIEGITPNENKTKNNNNIESKNDIESKEDKEIKSIIKNMNNYLSKKVDPNINKVLEQIQKVTKEINTGKMKKSSENINTFSKENKESTKVSSQKKVPPFPDNQIKNLV